MTVQTLFGQAAVSDGADGGVGTRTYGVWFQLSQSASLTGIWFYSAAGAGVLPTECEVWVSPANTLVASTQNLAPSWSGAAGSGWVKCTYDGSVTLSSGVLYCASVGQSGGGATNWAAIHTHYWDGAGPGASGLTSGIITAPNAAGSPTSNQDAQASGAGAPGQFPSGGFNASNWWVDVEVTSGGPNRPATGSLTVTPSFAGSQHPGPVVALPLAPGFASVKAEKHLQAATVTPAFTATGLKNYGKGGTPDRHHRRTWRPW